MDNKECFKNNIYIVLNENKILYIKYLGMKLTVLNEINKNTYISNSIIY